MKRLILASAIGAAACTTGPVRIVPQEVVVTRTERAIAAEDLRNVAPPAPLGPRPPVLANALDLVLAKLCEYVRYADHADPLLQHAAGVPVAQRVDEPVCRTSQ